MKKEELSKLIKKESYSLGIPLSKLTILLLKIVFVMSLTAYFIDYKKEAFRNVLIISIEYFIFMFKILALPICFSGIFCFIIYLGVVLTDFIIKLYEKIKKVKK